MSRQHQPPPEAAVLYAASLSSSVYIVRLHLVAPRADTPCFKNGSRELLLNEQTITDMIAGGVEPRPTAAYARLCV